MGYIEFRDILLDEKSYETSENTLCKATAYWV